MSVWLSACDRGLATVLEGAADLNSADRLAFAEHASSAIAREFGAELVCLETARITRQAALEADPGSAIVPTRIAHGRQPLRYGGVALRDIDDELWLKWAVTAVSADRWKPETGFYQALVAFVAERFPELFEAEAA